MKDSHNIDIEFFWSWDSYILGLGSEPAKDRHKIHWTALQLPNTLSIPLPVYQMFGITKPEFRATTEFGEAIPLYEHSRIMLEMKIRPTK